jgi:hypothetical protein
MDQTKKHIAISALVGAGYLVVALNAPNWVHGIATIDIIPYTLLSAPLDTQLLFGAMYPGVFLLGAVSTYAYLERGFVLPGVVVVGTYLVALWFEARGNPDQADLISVVGIYLIGWFVVLGAALLAGSLEWGIRRLYASRAEIS